MIINCELKNKILNYLENIINIKDPSWNSLELNIKLKFIHHFCSNIINNNNSDSINIPLKSIKPKKFIEFCGFNKLNNKKLFNDYLSLILNFTYDFRKKYVKIKNKVYYTYNNLPKDEYNLLLNDFNIIVYNFLIDNKRLINCNKLYHNLIGNNTDKIISKNINSANINLLCIKYDHNIIQLFFNNNININLELIYNSNKITNNIPVTYRIKLINSL